MTEAKDFVNLPPEDIVDSDQPDIVKVDLDPGSSAEASSTATMTTDRNLKPSGLFFASDGVSISKSGKSR